MSIMSHSPAFTGMHAINEVADVQARSASLGPAALTTEGRCGDAGNRGQPARSVQAGSSGPIVWFRVTDKPQPEPRIPDVKPAGASRDFTICKKLAAPRTRQMPDSPARADGHRRLAVPAAPAVRRALIHASKVARRIAHAADDLAGVCQVGWHGTGASNGDAEQELGHQGQAPRDRASSYLPLDTGSRKRTPVRATSRVFRVTSTMS